MNQLHECMANKQYNKLMLLLDLGHHPGELDGKGGCHLSKAVRSIKNLETRHAVVKKLLACGSEINCIDEKGFTPLERAVKKKDIVMVQFLIQNGANINDKKGTKKRDRNRTALSVACDYGNIEIVSYLLSKGANTNILQHNELFYSLFRRKPNYPLDIFWVAKWLNYAWLMVCLRNGVDINATNKPGETLLFRVNDDPLKTELLLKIGINPKIRNLAGQSMLHRVVTLDKRVKF